MPYGPLLSAHLTYFDGDVVKDQEGSELPSLAVAKEQAVLAMRDLIGETIKQGDEPQVEAVVIANDQGTSLATVPLVAALPTTIVGLLKFPEKVVPTNRFEQYRQNADECRSKAEGPDDKVSWLKLADAWLQMLPRAYLSGSDLAGWPKASDEDSKSSH